MRLTVAAKRKRFPELRTATLQFFSYSGGKRFRRLHLIPFRLALERLHAARFVKMNDRIELLGEIGIEVVALPFRLRPINDANRAFEPALRQYFAGLTLARQRQ